MPQRTFTHEEPGARQGYHFLYAEGAEDLVICGSGAVDGNCYAFWRRRTSDFVVNAPFLKSYLVSDREDVGS